MSDAVWYYAVGNEQRGPVGESELSVLIGRGEVGRNTLVWRDGMAQWGEAQANLPGALIPQGWVDSLPRSAQAPAAQSGVAAPSWDGGGYYHPLEFVDAIKTVILGRYAQFSGRARRREYWWWILFYFAAALLTYLLDFIVFGGELAQVGIISNAFLLVVLVPGFAVTARRLHDIGRSGWWQLIGFIPLLGWALMIWWLTRPGNEGDNQYGPA
jgi:uncharacterized membrane protein YhaH (DUF805 family)